MLSMKSILAVSCCLVLARAAILKKPVVGVDPEDAFLTTPELVAKYGYPAESHTVTTDDGYILTLHRIPHGKNDDGSASRPAVLLQHGLLSSSADWVDMGTEKGLGYILADAGYDVWLGNYRGNTYSRKHTSLSDEDNKFWEFSWHESGYYDIPAMIDKIIEVSGQDKIFYVGHSMGTTGFYVMGSTRPEYNDKIKAMFSLAPIAFMSHMTSPILQVVAEFVDEAAILASLVGFNEFAPSTEFMGKVGDLLCSDEAISQDMCGNLLFLVCGFDSQELDESTLPVIMGHDPAGSSVRQFVHYGQLIKNGGFRQYDYGLVDNMLKYGSTSPPDYDLSKVTAPVYLVFSDNDWLSAISDVNLLFEGLGNPVQKVLVPFQKFNHLDYLFAKDVKSLVYDAIITDMQSYE